MNHGVTANDCLAEFKTLIPFNAMSDSHLVALLQHCAVDVLCQGQVLFQQGALDGQHVYLLHGDVLLQDNASGETQLVKGRLERFPLAQQQPRRVTATAETDCRVLRVDSEKLDKLLSWSQQAEYMSSDVAYNPDQDEDAQWINTILSSNLFYKVPPTNLFELVDAMQALVVDKDEVILRQGEIGDGCYFIKEGSALVTRGGGEAKEILAHIGVGRCFGEDALLNETVRNATVTMTESGVLMSMSKGEFLSLLKKPEVPTLKEKQLSAAQDEGAVVVDLRCQEEYEQGHIRGAVNFPLHLLRNKQRLLSKDKVYVFYCDTGRRSAGAASLLLDRGYHIKVLANGLRSITEDNLTCDDLSVLHS